MDLEQKLRDLIKEDGDMPLDKFLSFVISYYYQHNAPIGRRGDFITAPEVSQMFGEMVGIWAARHWLNTGKQAFSLVEMGPGYGTMMSDILRGTSHVAGFHNAMEKIYLIEQSTSLIDTQKQKLYKYHDKISWVDDISHVQEGNLLIVANEFFDALPVKQFIKKNGEFHEVLVGINSQGDFALYNSDYTICHDDHDCPEDGVVEVSLTSQQVAQKISQRLLSESSAALIIDYGYDVKSYATSLQALKNHEFHDIFHEIGSADITYHVDFTALSHCFGDLDKSIQSQQQFLSSNGIQARALQLINNGADPEKIRIQLNRLMAQDQMGQLFKVLTIVGRTPCA